MAARSKRRAAAIAAALLLVVLLGGCGTPDDTGRIYPVTLENGETREVTTAVSQGYYMETVDGVPYFFEDEPGNACQLVPERGEVRLDSFTNGDRITVWWSIREETYPGYLHIWDAELVEAGSVDSLPQSVKDEIEAIKNPIRYFSPDDLPVLIHEEHTFTRTLPDGKTEAVTVSSTNGYLLITDSGSCIFARYHDDPNDSVTVIGQRDDPLFADLTGGDRVLVWFDGPIRESYPGQGTVFTVAKIMDGSMDELPPSVQAHVRQLEQLGRTFVE